MRTKLGKVFEENVLRENFAIEYLSKNVNQQKKEGILHLRDSEKEKTSRKLKNVVLNACPSHCDIKSAYPSDFVKKESIFESPSPAKMFVWF